MEYLKKKVNRKYRSDIKQMDFYKHYEKNTAYNCLSYSTWSSFIADLFKTLSSEMILSNKEITLKNLGKFRIKSKKLSIFTSDGKIRRRTDWKACWEYWESIYPGLTRDEIIKIKDKPVIKYENDHSNGETYSCFWDNNKLPLRFSKHYIFILARDYKRLLGKTVKDPNRKIFYYG